MPLPYAPPPKDSKVYRDLSNLKISGVTADQIDSLKDALFAQGVDGSEDEMRRLNLLGEVTNQQSNSGPIPGSMVIDQFASTTNNDFDLMFTPAEHEVWEFIPQWEIDRADSVSFYLGTPADKDMIRLAYFSSTGPDQGNEFANRQTIMYPYSLYVYISTSTGENNLSLVRHRVR